MKMRVGEYSEIILEEVYSGIVLVSEDCERFTICMRNSGFEFNYGGMWYSAKGGILEVDTEEPTDA